MVPAIELWIAAGELGSYNLQRAAKGARMVTNRLLSTFLMLGFISVTCSQISAGTFTFGTLPADGNLTAPAGSTVGWGYTITNNSATDWLVTDSLNADPFLNLNGPP